MLRKRRLSSCKRRSGYRNANESRLTRSRKFSLRDIEKDSTKHRQVRLGLVEVLFGVSGVLVIIGTILAMSELHKVKIAAVWVFVAAAIALSIAVGIRLTHEFSKPASAQSSDTERVCGFPQLHLLVNQMLTDRSRRGFATKIPGRSSLSMCELRFLPTDCAWD